MSNLSDRTVVLTGASSGIGAAAAEQLAALGANLVLVGRDEKRLGQVATGVGGAATEVADFASLDDVRALAARLLERHPRIHVLANNAGTVTGGRELSADGYELTFAVNHLAPFLLTNLLLDRLRGSAPARVVNTSSDSHRTGRIELDDLQLERDFGFYQAYANSKLANILFTRELARRLEGSGVVANAFHPGTVRTRIARDAGLLRSLAWRIGGLAMISPEKGAQTLVHLAASEEGGERTGEYFKSSRPARSAGRAQDDEVARALWEESERLTAIR